MKNPFLIAVYLLFMTGAVAQEADTLRLTGQAFDDSKELAQYPVSYFASHQVAPIDLSPYMPPTGYQGNQPSCVSWVVGYSLLGFLKAKSEEKQYVSQKQNFPALNNVFGPDVPDISQIYSPAYLYNLHQQIFSRNNCDNGMKFTEAFKLFNQFGCTLYRNYPYMIERAGCGTTITKKTYNSTFPRPNQLVFNTVEIKKEQIITQLNAGRIVMVGLLIDEDLKNLKPQDSVWKPNPHLLKERHALVCVGYMKKHFKMQNSWGVNFGKGGYFYLPEASIDTSIVKQLFVADYFPNELKKATFSRRSTNNLQLKAGEFIEGKASIKYELYHLDKAGNAFITALLPFKETTVNFLIKKGESKAIRYSLKEDLFFTYEKQISNTEIQVNLKPPGVPPKTKAKEKTQTDDKKELIISLSNEVIASLPKKDTIAAQNFEKQAFDALDKGDLNDALQKFSSADAAYSEYHSAYEAANKLRVRLKELGDNPTAEQKDQIKKEIKSNYWFGGERDKIKNTDKPIQNE